jgi:hypothetical protein
MSKQIEEIWLRIAGFDDYEVSNFGNVRSWKAKNGKGKGKAKEPSLLKAMPFVGRPYLRVALTKDGAVFHKRVHRLVLEAFVGECLAGMEGCHNDGDATNNKLENLRWDTKEENVKDIERHGNLPSGDNHPSAKLTDAQVKEIREKIEFHKGRHGINRELALEYGVSDGCISSIKRKAGAKRYVKEIN